MSRGVDAGAPAADGAARFEVERLSVAYGDHRALADVSLRIPRRGVTVLVGPSGCGKSTFLQCLNRLTDVVDGCRVTGALRVDGEDALRPDLDVVALRRRVGMVFQRPNPFPISIRRNLSLPLREHGVPRGRIAATIEEALREVGLFDEVRDRLDRPATELSGGQQQRLCIARALCLRPDAILFDEPCSALDPLSSAVVEERIVALRDRLTVVVVTHNLAQARRIADHVAVFWRHDDAGRLLEDGPAAALFERPRHPLVAEYLRGARG